MGIYFEKYQLAFNNNGEGIRTSLQWSHNGHDSVSNHQRLDSLLTVCSGPDQRKHHRSASLAFVKGIQQFKIYQMCFANAYNRSFVRVIQHNYLHAAWCGYFGRFCWTIGLIVLGRTRYPTPFGGGNMCNKISQTNLYTRYHRALIAKLTKTKCIQHRLLESKQQMNLY